MTVKIFDVNDAVVKSWNAGTSPVIGLKEFLNFDFGILVKMGKLSATSKWGDVSGASTWIIAVPTERCGEPYSQIVLDVAKRIATETALSTKLTVIVESTLEPGVENEVLEILAAARGEAQRSVTKPPAE